MIDEGSIAKTVIDEMISFTVITNQVVIQIIVGITPESLTTNTSLFLNYSKIFESAIAI